MALFTCYTVSILITRNLPFPSLLQLISDQFYSPIYIFPIYIHFAALVDMSKRFWLLCVAISLNVLNTVSQVKEIISKGPTRGSTPLSYIRPMTERDSVRNLYFKKKPRRRNIQNKSWAYSIDWLLIIMGWRYVSELLPLVDIYITQIIWVWKSTAEWYIDRENRRTRRKTCLSATLFITNPQWIDPDTNPGLRGERLATNRLSHGMARLYC
jgi:hypothetical protein